jgi:hypothetical protein
MSNQARSAAQAKFGWLDGGLNPALGNAELISLQLRVLVVIDVKPSIAFTAAIRKKTHNLHQTVCQIAGARPANIG